jgi:glycosyltransferase involved in cell wall biosynthesis
MSFSEPALSVIIPTYNRSAFVRQCIRSLRTCGVSELEIIVADDGSTDDTEQVVSAADPSARYLRQANTGTPATARNKGFEMSRGRHVAFLDCDDAWLPDVPARAVHFLDRHPEVDVVFGDARVGNPTDGFRSWIGTAGQHAFFDLPCRQPEPDFRVFEPQTLFRRMLDRNPVFIGAVLMRRDAFARAGGFDPALRGAADWELWLRMASRMTFAYFHQPLAIYSVHNDNMSKDIEGMENEFCLALKKVREKCLWLSQSERELLEQQLCHHFFELGYLAYDRGDLDLAKTRFTESLRACGPSVRAIAYWGLCALPFGLAIPLRRLKQAIMIRAFRSGA